MKNNSRTPDYIFLSHPWGINCPAYANGKKISITNTSSIKLGHSSNSIEFSASNHIGTHFDFPRHFEDSGNTLSDYPANFFLHTNIALAWIENFQEHLVRPHYLSNVIFGGSSSASNVTLLLIRTGASIYRQQSKYWEEGPGLDIGLADYIRKSFPSLTTVGIDSISITSLKFRDLGRKVHKEFLCGDRPLVLIEDMDLDPLNNVCPTWICASPLLIENADGAPATIIAKL